MQPTEYDKNATISIGKNMRAMLENGELDIYDLRRSIMEQEFPNERMRDSLLEQIDEILAGRSPSAKSKKIGRNEPCPCGSGKKVQEMLWTLEYTSNFEKRKNFAVTLDMKISM